MTRHGRLARLGPVKPILSFVGAAVAVVLVSTASVAGIAVWQIGTSFQPGVNIQTNGEPPPAIGPIDEPVNILLVGSDSGDGNAAYGARGETLNDVTILLHISPVSHSAIAVSLQRDMYVPINGTACHGNQGTRKINEALADGGLACAVSTVESLTGLNIGYAAKIEFDGVIAMSNAVGGVEVCVAVPMHDLQIHFDLEAGTHTLQGWDALQFLRSRHGVGDGSDTTRVSNQQLFLSALIRKIKAEGTLSNPLTVYAIARAAAENMQLSTSLNSVDAMTAMALAVKDIPLANISFVLYPAGPTEVDGVSGVKPIVGSAKVLTDAIAADAQIVVTGHPGGGVVGGADVVETPSPSPTNSPSNPTTPPDTTAVVQLPPSINGQVATQQTCTDGNTF
ncbi:MAG: LCP family protein [Pseudolysinimonas sp.]|uniref:LCP family protein n=1 Tax=Pseudolysinimonas sp. TaxID=2680009 RepID=UPI003266C19D